MSDISKRRKILESLAFWGIAVILTLVYTAYENDPYDPLQGEAVFSDGTSVRYRFIRSKVIGTDLVIAVDTSPEVTGSVEFRRVSSRDPWTRIEMDRMILPVSTGHGRRPMDPDEQLAVILPSLEEMGGKYAYQITLVKSGELLVVNDGRGGPVVTRYRGDISPLYLIPHILFILLSMLLGIRAALESLRRDGHAVIFLWLTLVTLLLGGFVFGPLVQKQAFGVLWSGVPLGTDLTDNKVLVELLFWLNALWFNTGRRKGTRWSGRTILIAGILTFLIYMIPHSLMGSAYDYTSG